MTSRSLTADAFDEVVEMSGSTDPTLAAIAAAIVRTVRTDLDTGEARWREEIEALREELVSSTETIDAALTNARGVEKPMALGEVAHRRSKKDLWALVLLALARELRPRNVLELGTCLGISGAYLASGLLLNGSGRLVTLEGAPALAARAAANLRRLGLEEVEVVPGLFRVTLPGLLERPEPIDLAFIDGHHDEMATQEYFEQLLPHLADDAVVVFDDIRWSDGMTNAWRALCRHPAVRIAVDLDRIGICAVGPCDETRVITLPQLTAMARAEGGQR